MEALPLMLIGILLLIVFALAVKVYFLQRSAKEITEALHARLTTDTNTLIDISSRDPNMRELAARINSELRLLREERRKYQRGDLELKEAVTNISHDLRTPLTAMSGYLDLLEDEDTSEAVGRYLSQLRNRTEALKELTEELFRYSIVTSQSKLNIEPVELVGAVEEALLSFYATLRERGIEPSVELPEAPVIRELDRCALSRILSNLIANAIKYSDGDLSVALTSDARLTISNSAARLDPVTVGRLFDRFYTVEVSRNSSGLGLSIAKLLTERMGGRIEASCSDGRLSIELSF